MAFGNVYVGENIQSFKSSPRFDTVDMVVLNIDSRNYVSSPYAKIVDDSIMAGKVNGKYIFTYDAESGKWDRSGQKYTDAEMRTAWGVEIYYAATNDFVDSKKAGDKITVNRIKDQDPSASENQNMVLTCELTRSGRTIEADCPLCKPTARQEICDSLRRLLGSYGYQPFQATGAEVNPLAELGDGVTLHRVYVGMYQQDLEFNSLMSSSISAPAEEEMDHEYEYKSASERKYGRQIAELGSELELQSDEISARVTRIGTGEGFGWSLLETAFQIYKAGHQNDPIFKIDASGLHVKGDGEFTGHIAGGTISIGNNFAVDAAGNMTAVNGTFSGTLTVGGTQITASDLRFGAQTASDRYSYWNTAYTSTSSGGYCNSGAFYGYKYNDVTSDSGSSYCSKLRVTNLYATSFYAPGIGFLKIGQQNGMYVFVRA